MIKIKYEQIINELYRKIINNELEHKNTVIMGDNSTGKTFLLEQLNILENVVLITCPKDKKLISNGNIEQDTILIDNIETVLTMNEICDINTFLDERFKNKKLVIVTHNLELISRLKDFNIINISRDCYGIYDGNDFNSYNNVTNLVNVEDNNDVILVTLLNHKLCNLWTSVEDSRLAEIKKQHLTKVQKLLLSQICEYID